MIEPILTTWALARLEREPQPLSTDPAVVREAADRLAAQAASAAEAEYDAGRAALDIASLEELVARRRERQEVRKLALKLGEDVNDALCDRDLTRARAVVDQLSALLADA